MSKSKDNRLDRSALDKVARVFSAFSDGTRLALLQELRGGARTVGELVGEVGVSQGNVSKQLQLLFDAGLLDRRKQGNQVYYSIADDMVFAMCELVCDKLNRDAKASAAFTFQI